MLPLPMMHWTSSYRDPPTDLTGQGPSRHVHKLVHYEAHTVCKWAVSILLECFLVTVRNSSCGKVMFLRLSVILFLGTIPPADAPLGRHPTPRQTPPCVARLTINAWYLRNTLTRGFIPKTIQWHIHAGSWSLVNCLAGRQHIAL